MDLTIIDPRLVRHNRRPERVRWGSERSFFHPRNYTLRIPFRAVRDYPGLVTIFQATVTIVSTLVATQLGIVFFMINRMDGLTRDLRVESQNLTRELRAEIRDLGQKLDTHSLAHAKGDVG